MVSNPRQLFGCDHFGQSRGNLWLRMAGVFLNNFSQVVVRQVCPTLSPLGGDAYRRLVTSLGPCLSPQGRDDLNKMLLE